MGLTMKMVGNQVTTCRVRMIVVHAETYRAEVIMMMILSHRSDADHKHDAQRQYITQISIQLEIIAILGR